MPARNRRSPASLAVKAAQLSAAVPQVVAHRVTRMALAGATLSPRDQKEFALMVAEKQAAFTEAFTDMALEAMRAHHSITTSWLKSVGPGAVVGWQAPTAIGVQIQDAMVGVLEKGMAPIHRKAVANAKRLARTKLR